MYSNCDLVLKSSAPHLPFPPAATAWCVSARASAMGAPKTPTLKKHEKTRAPVAHHRWGGFLPSAWIFGFFGGRKFCALVELLEASWPALRARRARNFNFEKT